VHGRELPSIREILRDSAKRLKNIAQNPYKEASLLLSSFLHVEPIWLISHDEDIIETPSSFLKNIQKREDYCPLEYLLNSVSFYSRDFYVDKRVLIPRPETEILVDEVISTCRDMDKPSIVEIGVGSGIISIMLSTLLPNAKVIATDISQDALEVARINAKRHSVEDKIKFVKCNLLDEVSTKIDILVSNPPYIKKDEVLDKNLSYEPDLALFGGEKGDEILKKIIDEAIRREVKILACEMGYDQKDKIENYLKQYNLNAKFYQDLAGIDRGFILEFSY